MSKNRTLIERWFSSELFAGVLIVIGLIVFGTAALLFAFGGYFQLWGSIDPEVSGQLGDLVGGVVGAIWALAGVILFYRALVREKATTDKIQFNDTFFRMLSQFNKLTESMNYEVKKGEQYIGSDTFIPHWQLLESCYGEENEKVLARKGDLDLEKELLKNTVSKYMEWAGYRVIHYFGFLRVLLEQLDEYQIDNQMYSSIIKESLSMPERSMLFYYLFSNNASENFKSLVLKHGILGNIDELNLLNPEHRVELIS